MSEFERDIALLLRAENRDPFRLLGPHIVEEGDSKRLVVRGFFPQASEAFVVLEGHPNPIPARRISPEGLFEAVLPLLRNFRFRRQAIAGAFESRGRRNANSTIPMRFLRCCPISICT